MTTFQTSSENEAIQSVCGTHLAPSHISMRVLPPPPWSAGVTVTGAITEADVLGDLYDLAGGAVTGRSKASDITMFKNAGGGHLDLMTCEVVFERTGGARG